MSEKDNSSAEVSAPIDHNKLREAIKTVRAFAGSVFLSHERGFQAFISVADVAESTLPKTKMVEVWHVHYAARTGIGDCAVYTPMVSIYQSEIQARETCTNGYGNSPMYYCFRLTGPHNHEIPA